MNIVRLASMVLCLGLAPSVLAVPAAAGTLKISLSAQATAHEDRIELNLTVRNLGTVPAGQVRLELQSGDTTLHAGPLKSLFPAKAFDHRFSFPHRRAAPGSYPYRVTCRYTDTEGHPLSAVLVSAYTTGPFAQIPLDITMPPAEIGRSGSIRCLLENRSGSELSVSYFLAAPDGFRMAPSGGRIDLAAHGKRSLSFKIENQTAIPGAAYPFYLVIEQDTPEGHATLVREAKITVPAVLDENGFARHRWKLFFAFFSGLFISILYGRVTGRKRSRTPATSSCPLT